MQLARWTLDLLYPPRCPACDAPTRVRELCVPCLAHTPEIRSPLCPICGVPFATATDRDHPCARCLARRPRFDQARACTVYGGSAGVASPVARALHQFKYSHDVTLAPVLGSLLAQRCPLPLPHDIVVPVPLHISRLRWRGFNQALFLAKPLAARAGIRLDPFALRRARATVSQVGLDESSRRRNLNGAFTVADVGAVRDRRILLVDDVYTTGATADECAHVLRRAGARQVDVLVLARVVREKPASS